MEPLKFKYTILYVNSVTDTLRFYEAAFGLNRAMLHESGDYGELDTGGTSLSFSSLKLMTDLGKNPAEANSNNPSFEIAFETNDVPAALSRALGAGASLVQDAEDMPWGQTTAYVTDNNGFLVELCTPVAIQP
ncbi:MAG: VOC family protein [Gammaproteobacteria bacterium]|nr:VOC family protein [Gammaproteobacteria bacterium]